MFLSEYLSQYTMKKVISCNMPKPPTYFEIIVDIDRVIVPNVDIDVEKYPHVVNYLRDIVKYVEQYSPFHIEVYPEYDTIILVDHNYHSIPLKTKEYKKNIIPRLYNCTANLFIQAIDTRYDDKLISKLNTDRDFIPQKINLDLDLLLSISITIYARPESNNVYKYLLKELADIDIPNTSTVCIFVDAEENIIAAKLYITHPDAFEMNLLIDCEGMHVTKFIDWFKNIIKKANYIAEKVKLGIFSLRPPRVITPIELDNMLNKVIIKNSIWGYRENYDSTRIHW